MAMCHHKLGDQAQARLDYDLAMLWQQLHTDLTAEQAEELAILRAEAEQVLGLLPEGS
jgi:hypothetical protein